MSDKNVFKEATKMSKKAAKKGACVNRAEAMLSSPSAVVVALVQH